MYIIIVGGGRLGYYLAKTLLAEGHEVLSEHLPRRIEEIEAIMTERPEWVRLPVRERSERGSHHE